MDHFWAKVDKRGPDECWEWQGKTNPKGYGQVKHRGMQTAHRIAWYLTNGEIPEGGWICHHCDNRVCCNPAHLYVGDGLTNATDRRERGRSRPRRGEDNGRSKLTVEQVDEIRAAFPGGRFRRGQRQELAERFGVTGQSIYFAVKGETWKGSAVGYR